MKRTATAIVVLFVLSFIASAFVAGCAVAMPSEMASAGGNPSTCCSAAACAGGLCFAPVKRDCTADSEQGAITQKAQAGGDLKPPAIVAAAPPAIVHGTIASVRVPIVGTRSREGISGYRDLHARTGRLLI
jgi:hypothetical protein